MFGRRWRRQFVEGLGRPPIFDPPPARVVSRPPRRKKCHHFEKVAAACNGVVSGRIPPSDLGTQTLAEEYLSLHLEFLAVLSDLERA